MRNTLVLVGNSLKLLQQPSIKKVHYCCSALLVEVFLDLHKRLSLCLRSSNTTVQNLTCLQCEKSNVQIFFLGTSNGYSSINEMNNHLYRHFQVHKDDPSIYRYWIQAVRSKILNRLQWNKI